MMRIAAFAMTPLLLIAALRDFDHSTAGLHVPPGFVIQRVAAEPDTIYPMFATFDDRGRLFVAESSGLDLYAELKAQTRKCRIRVLEDPDEAGRFRKSSVFAENLVFPMGLVWRDGKLYVADPPDLITLEDTDGDGKADRRRVILTGFGHVDNGSLHGLTFGPDGLLYMTMGQPDGYTIKRRDGVTVHGKTGALLRCRPDGSDPEVLCRGFENLVEVIFTPRGDMIGTDNWFQRPTDGMRDALVHLVDGGLYPLHTDRSTPQPVTGDFLPGVAIFPAVALSGLERYRGAMFAGMQGHLFSAQHNARKVGRHVLAPAGATFRSQDFDFVTSDSPDFHPSDVLEDADGSLLVIDTGSWYTQHCPTGKIRKVQATGGIYRVRKTAVAPVADPRGLRIDWSAIRPEELIRLLGDARPVVRGRAQHTLTQRGLPAIGPLAVALSSGKEPAPRQHALWALAGIDDKASLPPLRAALADTSDDIVIPAARALGLRRDDEAVDALEQLLLRPALPVRLAAAEALARCDRARPQALLQALEAPDVDRFLEHALVHALFHQAETGTLERSLQSPHARVQQAALILLDQPPRPKDQLRHEQVIERLRSPDERLRDTAVRVLRNHPEWAKQSLGLLRGWFAQPQLSAEETRGLRDLVLAYQHAPDVQNLLAQAVGGAGAKSPTGRRQLALEMLAATSLPKPPAAWAQALETALTSPVPAERHQAVRTAAVLQLPQLDAVLARMSEQADLPAAMRLEALRALILRRQKLEAPAFQLVYDCLRDENEPLLRLAAAELIGRAQLTDDQVAQATAALAKDSLIAPSTVLPALLPAKSTANDQVVAEYLRGAVRKGWRPSEQQLKQLVLRLGDDAGAIAKLVHTLADGQKQRLAELEPLLTDGDALKGRSVFFGKKVACATCHRVAGDGGTVGPDLSKIGAVRSGRDLLESIVVPSSTIAQGYESYLVITDAGKTLHGLIARQTGDVVVVRDASGAELQLRKGQIQEMRRAAISLMPEGLDRALSRDEFRDLLAYLQRLK
jgi:putative membrane-bound dehydrogenase-like protein